ncbi:MAG TPA: hypothetical protein VK901_21550 [Nitrospiraceae bacterium]|nr:hypothetical protein [Nitrospiraceae bacterium]
MKVVDGRVMARGDPGLHDQHQSLRSAHARQEAAISQVTVEGPNYCTVTFEISPGDTRPRLR